MRTRSFRLPLLAACAGVFFVRTLSAEPQVAKPNVVFVLADDLGYGDLGCYGSTFHETPNIDALAKNGLRFTSAYAAAPVCSPTQAGIQTGKYPARIGLTNFGGGNKTGKLIPPKNAATLGSDDRTIGQAFRSAGYRTAYFGKWHLGNEGPSKWGYDVEGFTQNAGARWYRPDGEPQPKGVQEGVFASDIFADSAIRFVESNRKTPFFLFVGEVVPHIPIAAKKEVVEKYRRKLEARNLPPESDGGFVRDKGVVVRMRQNVPEYAAMVEAMDSAFGRILEAFDRNGLAKNTIVVFTSDNGPLATPDEWDKSGGFAPAGGPPGAAVPLRFGKGFLYEGGVRVPLIVRWPGKVKEGTATDAVVTSTDFYPTLLAAAGIPEDPEQHRDGISFLPLLKGETGCTRPPVFWHYPHYANQGSSPAAAIRDGTMKLIESYEDGSVELYNLSDDIGERRDLAAEEKEIAARLLGKLRAWQKDVGAKMADPAPASGAPDL